MGNSSSSDSENDEDTVEQRPSQDAQARATLRTVTDDTYTALTDHDPRYQVIFSTGSRVFTSWMDIASRTPRAAELVDFTVDKVTQLTSDPLRPGLQEAVTLGPVVSGTEMRRMIAQHLESGQDLVVHGPTQKLTGHVRGAKQPQ
jgi:hypothetical protein